MNCPEILSYEEQAIDLVVSIMNKARFKMGNRQNLFQLANSRKEYIGRAKVNLARLVNPIVVTCDKLIRDTIERNWRLTDTVIYNLKYMDTSTDECSVFYYFEAVFSQPTMQYPIPQATVSVFFRVEDRHIDNEDRVPLVESRKNLAAQAKVALHSLELPLPVTGAKLIKDTIERTWRLHENFRYHLKYMSSSRDECSIFYYFEAIFSQPTISYPIPQATASVLFRVENKHIDAEERVPELIFRLEGHHIDHDVRYVTVTEDWLLGMLQMKNNFFKRIEQFQLF